MEELDVGDDRFGDILDEGFVSLRFLSTTSEISIFSPTSVRCCESFIVFSGPEVEDSSLRVAELSYPKDVGVRL